MFSVFFNIFCFAILRGFLQYELAYHFLSVYSNMSFKSFFQQQKLFQERLWCLFELAAFLKSKDMASAKQKLIVRPIFFGPISMAIFLFSFAVALPLTTVPLPEPVNNSTLGVIFVLGPALVSGLMVAYPTVTHLDSAAVFFLFRLQSASKPQEFRLFAFDKEGRAFFVATKQYFKKSHTWGRTWFFWFPPF